MMSRLTIVLGLVLLTSMVGCRYDGARPCTACECHRPPKKDPLALTATPKIELVGMVNWVRPTGDPYEYLEVSPAVPLPRNREIPLHAPLQMLVLKVTAAVTNGGAMREFHAIVGSSVDSAHAASFQFKTNGNAGVIWLDRGWVYLTGAMPVAETTRSRAVAEGTAYLLEADPAMEIDRIILASNGAAATKYGVKVYPDPANAGFTLIPGSHEHYWVEVDAGHDITTAEYVPKDEPSMATHKVYSHALMAAAKAGKLKAPEKPWE